MSSSTASSHSFGEILKQYRSRTDYTQTMIASELNVSRITYANWENDRNEPDFDQIRYLCRKFAIPINELFDLPSPLSLDENESGLIRDYRGLSLHGKRLARRVIRQISITEAESVSDEARVKAIAADSRLIGFSEWRMAAGDGCGIPDSPLYSDSRFVRITEANRSADLIMHVAGQSMEPAYSDGDCVYVQLVDYVPLHGTVVFATVSDQSVIKRVGRDGKLHSDNPDFPFADKFDDDNVHVRGIVLGRVNSDDLLSETDAGILAELQADKVAAFRQAHNIYL